MQTTEPQPVTDCNGLKREAMTAYQLISILRKMPRNYIVTYCDHDNSPDGLINEACNTITTVETVTDREHGVIIVLHS